jgi:hypothetical protein
MRLYIIYTYMYVCVCVCFYAWWLPIKCSKRVLALLKQQSIIMLDGNIHNNTEMQRHYKLDVCMYTLIYISPKQRHVKGSLSMDMWKVSYLHFYVYSNYCFYLCTSTFYHILT